MKLKKLFGMALAGAMVLSPAAAGAQAPTEPFYLAPKALYSYQEVTSFQGKGNLHGDWKDPSGGNMKGGDKNDKTFGGGVAIGYDLGALGYAPVRLEAEFLKRGSVKMDYKGGTNTASSGGSIGTLSDYKVSASVSTIFANAYLDFHNDSKFTPYIGAGVGGAYVDTKVGSTKRLDLEHNQPYYVDDPSYTGITNTWHSYEGNMKGQHSDWNFAWNASAGFAYDLTENVALDLSYRYSDFGEVDFGTTGYNLGGAIGNNDFDPVSNTPGTNTYGKIGQYSESNSFKITSHEVIMGLRISTN